MENTRTDKLIGVAKAILAVIFLYSGWVKLQDPANFLTSVASFKLVPQWGLGIVTATIPTTEVLAALLLFWKRTEGGAATCLTLLCLGFCVFYAYAWMNGIHPSCGCFGNNPLLQASPPQGIIRAAVIGLLGVAILKRHYAQHEG